VIKNLHQFKEYGSRRILTEFSKANCKWEGLGTLLKNSEMVLTQYGVVRIIHRDFGLGCILGLPTRLVVYYC